MQNTLPNSLDIENRVLVALMHFGIATNLGVQNAMLLLDTECFYHWRLRQLFELIGRLFRENKPFDFTDMLCVVSADLHGDVSELTNAFATGIYSANLLAYDVQTLLAYRTLRKQLKILGSCLSIANSPGRPADLLADIAEELQQVNRSTSTTRKNYLRSYEQIADEYLSEEFVDDSEISVDVPGLPPIPNRALITIAGRSGTGKTFFALFIMDKIIDCLADKQSLYFNLEMHERVMLERHARLVGSTGFDRKSTIKNGIHLLMPKNVSLISEPMLTIEEIETESRLASLQKPIAVIVVDYIGLIKTKNRGESKHLDQTDIAKRLAALSLELNCVVIALSQVNREFKNRPVGERCPQVSDAAESMGTVHSSSWWLGIDQPQLDTDEEIYRNLFQVQCRKNRGEGGLFGLDLNFYNCMFTPREKRFSSYQKPKEIKEIVF